MADGQAAAAASNTSRIQVHVYTPAGFESYTRLSVSPNSPFYDAVTALPREEQGDEVCRGIAYALAKYFGNPIPEVPIRWFRDNILPPLPKGLDLAQLIRKLRKDGHIVNKRWSVMPRSPRTSKQVGDVIYAPFAHIVGLIGQTAATLLPDREQVVAFQCNPSLVPISNFRENHSRPDCYGIYKGHVNYQPRNNRQIFWEFIVAPGKTKMNNSDADINDVRNGYEYIVYISDCCSERREDTLKLQPYHAR